MPHITSRSWTEADVARLKKLADEGATVNRAAAALNRKTDAVKKQCRAHGLTLVGTRQAKAAIRALDERASAASS
jgi:orotate phosphoribosyltransferase